MLSFVSQTITLSLTAALGLLPATLTSANPTAQPICERKPHVPLTGVAKDPSGQLWWSVSGRMGPQDARQIESPDLNDDGILDIVLSFADACMPSGDCPIAAYVNCGSEGFVPVLEPTVMWDVVAAEKKSGSGESAWLDLFEAVPSQDVVRNDMSLRVWRFDGSQYRQP